MTNDRLFLDTNVVLDLLDERLPFYESIAKIAALGDLGRVTLIASSLSYATVNYVLAKLIGADSSKDKLRKFKVISEISGVDETIVEKGLNSTFSDFEDSLQYYCALQAKCSIIITRNGKDFKTSKLPVMTAGEYLASIGVQ